MPPKRAAKKRGKRTARPATQTADGPVKSQAVSGRNADAATEIINMEEDISPELAELMDSAPCFDAVDLAARDTVLATPELLENILYFTGFKTLLTSVPRVSKYFNASVAASSRLQRVMFESFTPVPVELSDPSNHFLVNNALFPDTFQFPGTTNCWYFGRCCWSNSDLQLCKGDHFLHVSFISCYTRQGAKSATSWRKLRALLPLDDSHTCRVRLSFGAIEEFSADVTLGELYDLVQSRERAGGHSLGLYWGIEAR